jgi:hypothetical protein
MRLWIDVPAAIPALLIDRILAASGSISARHSRESPFATRKARRSQAPLMSVAHLAIKFAAIAERERRAQL